MSTVAGCSTSGTNDGQGVGNAEFDNPSGFAFSPDGTYVLITEMVNSAVRKMVLSSSFTVTTLAGDKGNLGYSDGVGTNAQFQRPNGISMDSSGSQAFIVDYQNYMVRKLTISDQTVITLAGASSGFYDGTGR